jgi:hypothetical protein
VRLAGHVARMGSTRNAYNVLVSEEKNPFVRPRCTWESNIRMDLGEIEWEGVYWIGTSGELL